MWSQWISGVRSETRRWLVMLKQVQHDEGFVKIALIGKLNSTRHPEFPHVRHPELVSG